MYITVKSSTYKKKRKTCFNIFFQSINVPPEFASSNCISQPVNRWWAQRSLSLWQWKPTIQITVFVPDRQSYV